jgi:hypothetical protein
MRVYGVHGGKTLLSHDMVVSITLFCRLCSCGAISYYADQRSNFLLVSQTAQ